MNKESQELSKLIHICNLNLNKTELAKSYFYTRGLDDKLISKFNLGYFPQNVSILKKYLDLDLLKDLKIIGFDDNSKFSEYNSIIFPIYNEYDEPVGISGRTLLTSEQLNILNISKYENSSYKKSTILYNLNNSKKEILEKNNCYIVEGNFDVISLVKNNINNAVALCGTAFSKDQFLRLSKYTDKITFILDNDDAGKKTAKNIYNKFSNKGMKLRFLSIPSEYKDLDDFFKENGKRDFFNKLKLYVPNWGNNE